MNKPAKLFAGVLSIVAWAAVILQFRLMIENPVAPFNELVVRFFSYFTILSNVAVATFTGALFLSRKNKWSVSQSILTGVAVSIFVVGLLYNIILRSISTPQGLARVVNETLHVLVPLAYVIFWYLFVPRKKLPIGVIWRWLLFPFLYIVFVLYRGNASGFYPYPFIDAGKLGLHQALIHSVGVAAVFVLVSFAAWYLGNKRAVAIR